MSHVFPAHRVEGGAGGLSARIAASPPKLRAVVAAFANVARAGVGGDVEVRHQPLDRLSPYPGPGWLVSNPPYGIRVGERSRVHSLWRELGRLVRNRLPDWRVGLIAPRRELESALGLRIARGLATRNGGLGVRLIVAAAGDCGRGEG